ncbi:MAG: hypothetical protein F4X11_09540 [Acidobacteria bacterium]|nr:hypothetical protein [Acidobacteriota bacterium]
MHRIRWPRTIGFSGRSRGAARGAAATAEEELPRYRAPPRSACRVFREPDPTRSIPDIVSVVTRSDGIDYLRQAVRQRVAAEGLRPFSFRTGIPVGQLRSIMQGRAARSTTLELMASALDLELYIGPARAPSSTGPGLPPAIADALGLPRDASVADALEALDRDALASRLRESVGLVQDFVDRTATAVALISGPASDGRSSARTGRDSAVAMIPFAPDVRLAAGSGEIVFDESPEMSIAVATDALATWARPERLTCVRAVGDSMEPTIRDGDLVAIDAGRTEPLDGRLFAVRTDAGLVVKRLRQSGARWLLASDNPAHEPRTVAEDDRILGEVAWSGPQGPP